ncbi:hypothetical protein C8R43DRAFT_940578 [Mycena crocata]|nr:hypothetical protein C8R43DRAFT_940578 [Mycena crocata]
MPVWTTEEPTTWSDYMALEPPPCPYKPLGTTTLNIPDTHEAGASSLAACSAPTLIKKSQTMFHRDLLTAMRILLNRSEEIIVQKDHIQPLFNEQAVAEVYFTNVISPVMDALTKVLLPILMGSAELSEAKYFFNVRPQQVSSSGGQQTIDRTRCDHFLVFEHMEGVPAGPDNAPPKDIKWQSMDEFRVALEARKKWNADYPNRDGPDKPAYPRLVLCIIEEKKPNVVIEAAFIADYDSTTSQRNVPGCKNLKKILPQIKKYSVDASCDMVLLTDYLTTMVLKIKNAGAGWENGAIVRKPRETPEIHFYCLNHPPRESLLTCALARLKDAKLIVEDKNGPEPEGFKLVAGCRHYLPAVGGKNNARAARQLTG